MLAGCGIETYRSMTGRDRNDPDPETALFTGNLTEAEGKAYPNLASVPPPPTRATTAAERQKLAEALIAERSATEASAKLPPGLVPPPAKAPEKPGKTAAKSDTATAPTAASASPGPGNVDPGPRLAAAAPAPVIAVPGSA